MAEYEKATKIQFIFFFKAENIDYMNILITPYIVNYLKAAVPGGWGEIFVRYHSNGVKRLE